MSADEIESREHGQTVHGSAVLVGDRAVLIRGASGAGKSRLAFDLIMAGRAGQLPLVMLIGDDRVLLQAGEGGLMVHPAPELVGLIEIRGLGIRRCDFATEGRVALVVDLAAEDAARMPSPSSLRTIIHGVEVDRIPVAQNFAALPLVIAALTTGEYAQDKSLSRL
jgi:HPr kinase/phosphorylase